MVVLPVENPFWLTWVFLKAELLQIFNWEKAQTTSWCAVYPEASPIDS